MGSVSMQSQASSRGERLSAFVDGELFGEEHLNKFISELDGEDRAAWSDYHLIGDALRSDDLAVSPAASSAFMSGFAARFEARRTCSRLPRCQSRALAGVRRRVVPAFAVAAAAATLTWIVVPQLQGVGGLWRGASRIGHRRDSMQRVAMASVPVANGTAGRAGRKHHP